MAGSPEKSAGNRRDTPKTPYASCSQTDDRLPRVSHVTDVKGFAALPEESLSTQRETDLFDISSACAVF